ncbi:hypothetical protein INR49_006992 [Caranx melampygus]|nr:hypothetical protein INR49_006992 [Caranx melampygus]
MQQLVPAAVTRPFTLHDLPYPCCSCRPVRQLPITSLHLPYRFTCYNNLMMLASISTIHCYVAVLESTLLLLLLSSQSTCQQQHRAATCLSGNIRCCTPQTDEDEGERSCWPQVN